jgi:hypothetical protein
MVSAMRILKNTILQGILFVALTGLGWSQTVPATDQIITNSAGFSTSIPAHFVLKQDASGAAAVEPNKGYIVTVKNHQYNNFEAFAAEANLAKDGFTLVGDVRNINDTDRSFRAYKATPKGNLVADTFVRFSPRGGGSLVVVFSDDAAAQEAYYSGYRVSEKIQFSTPALNAVGSSWQALLANKHLVYLYTSSGYSERRDLYLLSSGQFRRSNDASSLSQSGSGAVNGGSDGTWQIVANSQLVLVSASGEISTYQLAQGKAGNEILLNGKRYFVMDK